MKEFVVTKQTNDLNTTDQNTNEGEVHIELGPEEPPKARYATKVLFLLLLTSGAILIGSGVSLLEVCRQQVDAQSCSAALTTEPCSQLAVSGYLGCALILTTIFGFGCIGRKAMAAVLVPIVIAEISFGIYLLVIPSPQVNNAIFSDLDSRLDFCRGIGNDTTTTTIPGFTTPNESQPDVFHCWKKRTVTIKVCDVLWSSLDEICGTEQTERQTNMTNDTSLQEDVEITLDKCSIAVNWVIATKVKSKLFIVGPLLLTLAVFHLTCAVCLYFLRKSTPFGRGLGMISLPHYHIPMPFARAKYTPNPSVHDLESRRSLLLHPNGRVVKMKKLAFMKLRHQKNTYATV